MQPVKTKRIRQILSARGCMMVGVVGSHEKWRTPGGLSITIVAGDKEQSAGLCERCSVCSSQSLARVGSRRRRDDEQALARQR